MNLLRLTSALGESLDKTVKFHEKLVEKLCSPNLIVACEYKLFKALNDLVELQEKIEFFVKHIDQCNFSDMNDNDFSVYIAALEEKHKILSDFQKKSINEDRIIK